MIITQNTKNSLEIIIFDCVGHKIINLVKSFNTKTKEAIILEKRENGCKEIKIYLPDCIAINCITKKIIR